MSLKHVGLQLDTELLERVDLARGNVPRQRWIAARLEEVLSHGNGTPPPGSPLPDPSGSAPPRAATSAQVKQGVKAIPRRGAK